MDLLVVAKTPVAGRVKTRLCPPCTPAEAAALAEAALADTLAAASATGADRLIVALDGAPGAWLPPGAVVVDQGAGSFDRRLARAWSHVQLAGLQIGMDTPHVAPADLDAAMEAVLAPEADAVFGPAEDGGWWAIGMRPPDPDVFLDVPTGRGDTGQRQRHRLLERGRRVRPLPVQRDVDTFADARAVAAAAPHTRFARAVAGLSRGAA
jgi:glycosyltransferase A (GT-A) superfamily protein (DUF2064 family)